MILKEKYAGKIVSQGIFLLDKFCAELVNLFTLIHLYCTVS